MASNDNLQDYLTALANAFRYATNSTEKINAQDMISLPVQLGEAYKDLQTLVQKKYTSDQDIIVPLGVTKIGAYAYYTDVGVLINKIVIPEGVKEIGNYSFGMLRKKEIYMPSTIEKTSNLSFAKTDKTYYAEYNSVVYYSGTIEKYLSSKYMYFWNDEDVHSVWKNFSIDGNLYINNELVKNVKVPKNVTELNMSGLYHKEGVLTFEEDNQLKEIINLPYFSKIYLPKGNYKCSWYSYRYSFDEFYFEGTMQDYLNLTVNSDSSFFYGTHKLYFNNVLQDKIIIPEGVVEIPQSRFRYSNVMVSEIVISSTVVKINASSFAAKSANQKQTIRMLGTTPPTIQYNSFTKNNILKIIVPASAIDTYKTATNWSSLASLIYNDTKLNVEVDGLLINNPNISYSIDGGTKQNLTSNSFSAESIGFITIYNNEEYTTLRIGTTQGGSDIGTISSNASITYTPSNSETTIYITKA